MWGLAVCRTAWNPFMRIIHKFSNWCEVFSLPYKPTEKHLIVAGACPGQSRKNKWLRLYFRMMPRGLAIIRGIISYIKNSILFSALATSYFIGVWARASREPLGPGPRGTLGPGPQGNPWAWAPGEPLGPGTFFGHVFRARFSGRFFGQVFFGGESFGGFFSGVFFRKL